MKANRFRLFSAVLTGAALLVGAQNVSAQVDMAGQWTLTVESETGTTNPTLVLEQDGMSLTGHYSSATLGEADVTGSIDGQRVTVTFMADPGVGMQLAMTYNGTVDENGEWSGSLEADAQGQTMPIGTFTATKD